MVNQAPCTVILDSNFHHLLALTARDYLTPEQLMNEKLPANMTFHQTWDALTAIRRAGAIEVPFQEREGFAGWYSPTFAIMEQLRHLEHVCASDSSPTRYARQAKESDIYAESMADEIVGTVLHDNVNLDRARTVDFLTMHYAPRNNEERLLRNIYSLTEHLEEYVDRPFSLELINDFFGSVVEGVDVDRLNLSPFGYLLESSPDDPRRDIGQRHLPMMLDYANGVIGDPHDHPLMRATFLRTFFSRHEPCPSMNNTIGRFLFCLMCLKHDLPFVCMVPFSQKLFEWLEPTLLSKTSNIEDNPVSTLRGQVPSAVDEKARSSDFTAWATLALQLLAQAVAEVERRIQLQQESNKLLEGMIVGSFIVNHRQQAILSRALRNPHETFLIRQHRIDQKIAYGTARSDLLELAEAGFLRMEKDGKQFVFRPSPFLHEKLRKLATVLDVKE